MTLLLVKAGMFLYRDTRAHLHASTIAYVAPGEIVAHYEWEALADRVPVNCFKNDPSVKSSLKF